MPSISRRRFLRNASIGAAATGVAAAGGLSLLTGVSGADVAPPTPAPPSPNTPIIDGSGVVAHVVDARSGQISLYVGTQQINYTSQALAQELIRATQ